MFSASTEPRGHVHQRKVFLSASDKPGYLTFDTAAVTGPASSHGPLQSHFLD